MKVTGERQTKGKGGRTEWRCEVKEINEGEIGEAEVEVKVSLLYK